MSKLLTRVDAVEEVLRDTLRLKGMGAGGAGIANYREAALAIIVVLQPESVQAKNGLIYVDGQLIQFEKNQ